MVSTQWARVPPLSRVFPPTCLCLCTLHVWTSLGLSDLPQSENDTDWLARGLWEEPRQEDCDFKLVWATRRSWQNNNRTTTTNNTNYNNNNERRGDQWSRQLSSEMLPFTRRRKDDKEMILWDVLRAALGLQNLTSSSNCLQVTAWPWANSLFSLDSVVFRYCLINILFLCISYISHCCDRTEDRSNVRKKGLDWGLHSNTQSVLAGQSQEKNFKFLVTFCPNSRSRGMWMLVSAGFLLFILGLQPKGWCRPYLTWAFTLS